jgi:hypothetical protein
MNLRCSFGLVLSNSAYSLLACYFEYDDNPLGFMTGESSWSAKRLSASIGGLLPTELVGRIKALISGSLYSVLLGRCTT